MCGIFGIVEREGTVPDRERLLRSVQLMAHRGPDDASIYSAPCFGFGHTRLSLLDLSERSNQPLWDHSGRYCLVYNGEIYNYRSLRTRLEREGISFRTTSDTEVLLYALIHWGARETLPRLEGMYAFGLYDSRTATVTLGRDRFGIKPLFLYDDGQRFVFASEIRAMRPWVRLEPEPLSISSYLHGFGAPTSGHTFFRHVRIVAPGTVVELAPNRPPRTSEVLSVDDLWAEDAAAKLSASSDSALIDTVEEVLSQAVDSQLVADAPVGALCSGGVDSSVVVALAARSRPDLTIFHADIVGRLSERDAAETLARHLGLELQAVPVRDQDVIDLIPEVTDHTGHPFFNTPHSVPFMLVSRLANRHGVKAVLSGEGSDECFLGYRWQLASRRSLRSDIRRIAHRVMPNSGPPSVPSFSSHFSPHPGEVQRFTADLHNRFQVALDLEAHRRRVGHAPEGESGLATLDALGYNLRALLHRNDAMGMSASIEARFPFLDTELVRLAVNLPLRAKLRPARVLARSGGDRVENKWILRRLAERHLPPSISGRPKLGLPMDTFQRMEINGEFWRDGSVVGFFDLPRDGARYLAEHAPSRLRLRLLHLEVWMQVCVEQTPVDDVADRLRSSISVRAHTSGLDEQQRDHHRSRVGGRL